MSLLRQTLLVVLLVSACGGTEVAGRNDMAPVVSAGADQQGAPAQALAFVGSATPYTGRKIVSWSWDFGDGKTATTQTTQHSYAAMGTYTVKLTATDDLALEGSDTLHVTIAKPTVTLVAQIAGAMTGMVGTALTLDGSGSTPAASITTYEWSWGDTETSTGETATHTYSAAGTFNVTLTVSDAEGDTNTSAAWAIVVSDMPAATLPSPSSWSYAANNSSDMGCGGFMTGPLTITVSGSSMTIVEGGGGLGDTTYTGSYTASTRAFSVSASTGLGGTQGFDCSFSADYKKFIGNYNVSFLGCSATIAVTGTRTSPP